MVRTGQRLTDPYVAGLVDADGCIRWNQGTPQVTVTGCYAPTLERLAKQFGGSVLKGGKNLSGDRPVWRWQCTGDTAMGVLDSIEAHLREKKDQARLVQVMRRLGPGERRDALETQLSDMKTTHYHLQKETKKCKKR